MASYSSFEHDTRLYNLDKTSTSTDQRPGKVLAWNGTNVAKVTSSQRDALVTTCCMLLPRNNFKPHMVHGMPPDTLGFHL